MERSPLVKAMGTGTILQGLMVVIGHFLPAAQQAGWFPIAGSLIGILTGWLAGKGMPGAAMGKLATNGGLAGAVAGILGSLISTALGDVPIGNIGIAGVSTLVMGAIGGILTRFVGQKAA